MSAWDYAGTTGDIPDEMWIGLEVGRWPITAFVSEEHATDWLGRIAPSIKQRRVWKVRVSDATEFVLTPPIPSRLVLKDEATVQEPS